jgi:anti-anti-sigma factor
MELERRPKGVLLELVIRGVLDNDSSVHFRDEIESSAREGWHRILVDMSGITYVSSAGIAALLTAKRFLEGLQGLFGIYNVTPEVEQILSLTRLLGVLRCDPEMAVASEASGARTITISSTTRFAREPGLSMQIYALEERAPLTCRRIGNPESLFAPESSENVDEPVMFGRGTFGFGLGTLGGPSDSHSARHGEFLSAAGAIALSPHTSGSRPDYSVITGDFIPSAQVRYGLKCEGDLPVLIRFDPEDPGGQIGLSQLVRACLIQSECPTAGMVILSDCAGLVGAQLRQWPSSNGSPADRFTLPAVRDWLSFSAERIHRHNLVLIVGVAVQGAVDPSSPLHPLLRPMDVEGDVWGHFHAAVFPYRPLKKRTLELEPSVKSLFESGSIEDVLHLLRDDRPITGSGESELLSGACWIGPIENVTSEEVGA